MEKSSTRQGLLYCCVNGGIPSLFAFTRTAISATITEGAVKATDISFENGGAEITISKQTSRLLYVMILGY